MGNLNRAAAAQLARVICQDVIRWEPDAYQQAFERKTVEVDIADSIAAAREIFMSRAPVYEDLFRQAVAICLVEGDFESYARETAAHSQKLPQRQASAPEGVSTVLSSTIEAQKKSPTGGHALARYLNEVSTLTQLTFTPEASQLRILAKNLEAPQEKASVTAIRSGDDAWLITMRGTLGLDGPLAALSPEKGFLSYLTKKTLGELTVGHDVVDDAYLIRARAEAMPMLRRLLAPLARLVDPAGEVRFEAKALNVTIQVEGTRDAAIAIDTILDLWSRELSARIVQSL